VTTPLAELLERSVVQREWALKLVADLTDEQLAARPTPTAHSIGWTLWHVAPRGRQLPARPHRPIDLEGRRLRGEVGTS
jgi:DinB family protein